MRLKRPTTAPHGQLPAPAHPVRAVVVCLPADTAASDLSTRALDTVRSHGVQATGVLPYFRTRTRRARNLIDRWQGWTSGGPLHLLDLDVMRRTAVAAAAGEWALWQHVVAGTKPANPWWSYLDKYDDNPDRYPFARARAEFLAQPRILAMTAYNALPNRPAALPVSAIEALQTGYTTYLNLAWLAAVPGDGLAPGHVGWLTSSSDRLADQLAYLHEANTHLHGLRPETPLVAVSCPI